jgi:hypothetical protein
MAWARILPYYDYFDACLAAHQLQLEGIHAEVLDYTLSTAPWPDCGFRLLVIFPDPDETDPKPLVPIEPGRIGRKIDSLLRASVAVAVFGTSLLVVLIALKAASASVVEPLIRFQTVLATAMLGILGVLLLFGGWFCSWLYAGYRKGNLFSVAVFSGVGFLTVFGIGGPLPLLFLFFFFVSKLFSNRNGAGGKKTRTEGNADIAAPETDHEKGA